MLVWLYGCNLNLFNHQGWLKQLQLTANIILMKDHFDSPVEVNDLLVLCSEEMAPFLFSEPSILCLFLTSWIRH